LERGEIAISVVQFVALVTVVVALTSFTPGQNVQSSPVITSVYWGANGQGVALHSGQTTKVTQNQSFVTAYFSVAFSTQVSAVSGSRLCVGPSSAAGEATTYTTIQFSPASGSLVLSPAVQQPGWVCTYTIKVTDALSQTTTWLGSVQFNP